MDENEIVSEVTPAEAAQNLQTMALAMAYVPYQTWEKLYEAEVGFARGTLFPSLDKPYLGEAVPKNE